MTANIRRPNTHPVRIPDVETVPCPAGGTHQLAHVDDDTVACTGCDEGWWAIDAAIREQAAKPKPRKKSRWAKR